MNDSVRELPFVIKERVASSWETDESDLAELAKDNDSAIRLEVASNKASTVNVLRLFANERDKHIISILIKREELPADVLESISLFLFRNIALLMKEGVSEDLLLLDSYLCANAVSHISSSPYMLSEGAEHSMPLVRLGAISNPNLTADTIYEMLLREEDPIVLDNLIRHRNADEAVVRILESYSVNCDSLPQSYLTQLLMVILDENH